MAKTKCHYHTRLLESREHWGSPCLKVHLPYGDGAPPFHSRVCNPKTSTGVPGDGEMGELADTVLITNTDTTTSPSMEGHLRGDVFLHLQ